MVTIIFENSTVMTRRFNDKFSESNEQKDRALKLYRYIERKRSTFKYFLHSLFKVK